MSLVGEVRSLAVGVAKRIAGPIVWQALSEAVRLQHARWEDRHENRRHLHDGPCIAVFSEGTQPHAYHEFLSWLAAHDQPLRCRIRLGRLPASLPPAARVLHAWVQDPVRERCAATFRQLSQVEAEARDRGMRIIHPAAILSNSRREIMFTRLRGVGLRTPRVVPVASDFEETLGGLSLPLMVRRPWGHIMPMVRLDSRPDVTAWFRAEGPDATGWVATEYLDVASQDGHYRKYRYVMAGDRGIRRHLIVSPHWEVRPKDRVLTEETIAEEIAFVEGRYEEHDLLDRARRALEFEIAAFDYSYDQSGTLIVWEVNPYPDLSSPPGRPGQYLAPVVERTFRLLADFYRDALAETGEALQAPWG